MIIISNIILPIIIVIVVLYGLYKKIDIFTSFINGIKEGLSISLGIFPTIMAMSIAINIFIKSNIINDILISFSYIFTFLHIPQEIIPMAILRPISGTASLMAMNDIFINYGVDSKIGKIASVIQGSTDTTIYIIGLYFGSIGIKKIKYALIIGLLADLICIFLAIIFVNLYY